jgi:glycolate dehydrogenase FAD-binding subunit
MAVKARRAAPRAGEAPEPAAYALGGVAPQRVVAPTSVEALAAELAACDAGAAAVVLFGGATLQGVGARPARYDVACDLRRLSGVAAYEPSDLTISVRAGTTLSALARTLAKHGQFVPLDAPLPARGTVGGALASGWLGPRVATYGRGRDFVIGSTVVLADGTVAKAGGMVVKNVTGYDMSRLYCGSLGTLGALAIVNLKTLPLPAVRRAAIAPLPEATRARTVEHVRALTLEPTAALVVHGFREIAGSDGIDGRLLLFFEGSQATVDRATRDMRSALGAAGVPATTIVDGGAGDVLQHAIDACVAVTAERSATYRWSGLPSDAEARCAAVARIAKRHALGCDSLVDLRAGIVVLRVSAATGDAFDERIVPFDDAFHDAATRVVLLQSPERIRERLDAWGAPPPSFSAMRDLKARFDPRATLAPGRFVGGL